MQATLSPGRAGTAIAAPRLAWGRHLTFTAPGRPASCAQSRRLLVEYMGDMLAPHGIPLDAQRLTSGNENSYEFLAGQFVRALPAGLAPDLIVLAHGTGDCEPSASVAGHLATLLPGEQLCFAVSDQGELAPFSALHLVRGLTGLGAHQRALVLVLDQSTLGYGPRREHPDGAGPADTAIGMLLTTEAGAAGRPLALAAHRPDVAPGQLAGALASLAASLPADPAGSAVTVLAGPHVAAADLPPAWGARPARRLLRTVPAPPCVAPWAALTALPVSTARDRIIVIEYDQALTALGVAVFGPVTTAPEEET
jgi:hypothetical protein